MASKGGFSYAQAARGAAPSSNGRTTVGLPTSTDHGSKEQAGPPATATSHGKPGKMLEKDLSPAQISTQAGTSRDTMTRPARPLESASEDQRPSDQKRHVSHEHAISSNTSETATTSNNSGTESSQNPDQKSDSAAAAEQTKEGDEDWEKVSVPSIAPEKVEKELTPAPVPTVNIWEQRKAMAKQQAQPAPKIPNAPIVGNKQKASNGEDSNKRNPNGRETSATDTRQTVAANKDSLSGNARDQAMPPRSALQQESAKPVIQQTPPGDAKSWPTPDTSNTDTGRRSSAAEKIEKPDAADATSTARQTKWKQFNVTPTYIFETPLPGSARRGGRTGTRGRGGVNTSNQRNGEKNEPGSMAPPPLPKTVSEQDRGRKPQGERANRASSVPSEKQVAEASIAHQSLLPNGKTTQPSTPSDIQQPARDERNSGIQTPISQDKSRASSRDVDTNREQQPDASLYQAGDATTIPPSPSRQSERGQPSQEDSYKVTKETHDRSPTKEYLKDRSPQKAETWRPDRRSEDQTKRGRGGFRGRGGHNGYNPSHTSPLPQHEFETGKSSSFGDRSRQSSQTYGSPYNSRRLDPRSRSIPLQMQYFQPPAGFPQTLPPIQTEMYGYSAQMPSGMPSAVMSAGTPYDMGGFGLVSSIAQQLEYYFSVDNLCKDMFLRKNMDSQGFVLLRVIADFRRVKNVLQDGSLSYEQLRHIAQQCRNTEYLIGEDNEDRLRSRDHWRDFVLPMEQRVPQAQNDGPQVKPQYPRHSTGMIPEFQMGNSLRSAPPNVNGFHDAFSQPQNMQFQSGMMPEPQSTEQWAESVENARYDEERRMSTTSPLSKVQSPNQDLRSVLGSMTNGHRDSISSNATAKENTFPDEEVNRLKVVVKDPEYQGDDDVVPGEPMPVRMSGLRGGASSPEQFERFRSLQFGQGSQSSKTGQHTAYFTQGDSPPHYSRPGYIHEDYVTLREQAISQRAEGRFDGACIPLYPFLAEFLTVPHQFNVNMYQDFKTWAIEDREKGNNNGKTYLVKFYDTMLSSKTAMTERLATDIVDIARKEPTGDRPVWLKLRAAWRNGATNMKTRKRLTDLLSADEQTELDRSAA